MFNNTTSSIKNSGASANLRPSNKVVPSSYFPNYAKLFALRFAYNPLLTKFKSLLEILTLEKDQLESNYREVVSDRKNLVLSEYFPLDQKEYIIFNPEDFKTFWLEIIRYCLQVSDFYTDEAEKKKELIELQKTCANLQSQNIQTD